MNIFRMKGAWGPVSVSLYEEIIERSMEGLFRIVIDDALEGVAPGGSVLDVGCGSGRLAAMIASRGPGLTVAGVDLDPGMIGRASRRGACLNNLSFRVCDAMALDLPDGGFDAVVSVGSIKHWPDPVRGLKEARRVCRGAGRVVVAEVHRGCSIEDCRRLVSGWRWMLPGGRGIAAQYFNRFVAAGGVRREDLFAWAGEAGFEDIHARSVPGWPYIMATAKA